MDSIKVINLLRKLVNDEIEDEMDELDMDLVVILEGNRKLIFIFWSIYCLMSYYMYVN